MSGDGRPTPPAPLPEGKGEKNDSRADDVNHLRVSEAPLPFREGGLGGVGLPPRGALLAIDFGLKRIGLAVCDPDRVIASPLGTHDSGPGNEKFFRNLFAQNKFVGIVVGLPLHANGDESDMSRSAREFAKWLSDLSGLPAVMWDERCSSAAAESVLRDANLNWKKRKGKVDRVAAQMILQTYLDAKCPATGSDSHSG